MPVCILLLKHVSCACIYEKWFQVKNGLDNDKPPVKIKKGQWSQKYNRVCTGHGILEKSLKTVFF
jgi:hypothetical protein